MKLHDLRPAAGAHKAKTRAGRGIAAGKGKTAGRGTKGQKARAGGTIPAWFEGGQTPLHQRLPKLRGFKNAFRIEYEIVNLGDIARLVELGVLESGELPAAAGKAAAKGKAGKAEPVTVNQEILRAAGLVRTLDRPLKILGGGELSSALLVVADAYSASARAKIEAAGGTANVIEATGTATPAIGLTPEAIATPLAEPEAPAVTEAAPAPAADPEPQPKTPATAPAANASTAKAPKANASKANASTTKAATTKAPAAKASAAKSAAEPAAKARAARTPATAPAEAAPAKPGTSRRKAATAADETTGSGDAG